MSSGRSRAPNRTLSLAELERPDYRRVVDRLEHLLEREPGTYLHPSKRWEYPWALERAGLEPGGQVLDAGCGASIFPFYLAEVGQRVVALDREFPHRCGGRAGCGGSHQSAARAGPRLAYAAADLTALPLPAAVCDAVFCISVVEHLPPPALTTALRELRRVLRPGGSLLLTTDYYRDAGAELWHEGPDRRFRVDWSVFDRDRLERRILDAPGWRVAGAVDLDVDWPRVEPRMRAFHGYPYTSVGVKLVKA